MKLYITILSILFTFHFLPAFSQDTIAIRQVSAHQLDSLLSHLPLYQVVDVRTPEEFSVSHVKGALLQNVKNDSFAISFPTRFPDQQPVMVVYCRSGVRSMQAAKILTGLGYQVINVTEGIQQIPDRLLWKKPQD